MIKIISQKFIKTFLVSFVLMALATGSSRVYADILLPGWEKYQENYLMATCPFGQVAVECNRLIDRNSCTNYDQNPLYYVLDEFKYDVKYCTIFLSPEFWKHFFIAIVLTILIELAIWMKAGIRSKNHLLAIAGVNLLTVPLVNYALFVTPSWMIMLFIKPIAIVLMIEAIVVVIEWGILGWVIYRTILNRKIIVITVLANISSYIAGLLLKFVFRL